MEVGREETKKIVTQCLEALSSSSPGETTRVMVGESYNGDRIKLYLVKQANVARDLLIRSSIGYTVSVEVNKKAIPDSAGSCVEHTLVSILLYKHREPKRAKV